MTAARASHQLRVLISGAGSGIGFACARAFAAMGAELILTDHDAEALTRSAELLAGYSRFCDVVSDASVAIFAADIEQSFDSFDVLINAAGNGYVRSLGMVRMAKALLPLLRKGKGARMIVNVAPCCEQRDGHKLFPHASSRTGFRTLHDAIAAQTRGSSISVVAVRVKPRPTPASREIDCGYDELAEGIVQVVRRHRPEWIPQPRPSPQMQKRA